MKTPQEARFPQSEPRAWNTNLIVVDYFAGFIKMIEVIQSIEKSKGTCDTLHKSDASGRITKCSI